MLSTVCREHVFKDSFLFYRFIDDDQPSTSSAAAANLIGFSDRKQCDEEMVDSLTLLCQVGPDASLRAILRKTYVLHRTMSLNHAQKSRSHRT
jgi:Rap guanine nucleotide exchange factor 4